MKPANEPEQADQTLLPGAQSAAPGAETPPPPAMSDATVDMPARPHAPFGPVDPGGTIASGAHPAAAGTDTDAGGATMVRPSASGSFAGEGPGGATMAPADPGATQVGPGGGYASGASTGPLGTDTAAASLSNGAARARPSPGMTGTMVDRFALTELHATGGLGEVFKARDTELNREVAVKRIKSHYADDPGSRRRFLSEAQLTARLDHPGVVPVFGLVSDVRGRPCYAMRFIRGETLKDEIDRYHGQGAKAASPDPEKTEKMGATGAAAAPGAAPVAAPAADRVAADVPRTVAFRHLLSRFIATCQAIGYAHSRGIIHRDIKPANVMVGTFGETLVVDWGLAKSLDDSPDLDRLMAASSGRAPDDPEQTDLPSHVTLAGTAVGTPAYMAPEQAAGDLARVGPAADIYALGATLYVILTGRAPMSGKTVVEVLSRAVKGEYEPPAAVNPECPRPLDAVARKAMAFRPEDRYASALELAADVERWLSDEPVSCYHYPLPARLARWARRHPARVAAGVSLLIAGLLAAGGIAWAVHEGEKATRKQRDRVVEEQKKTAAALEQVTEEQGRTSAALRQVTREQGRTEEQRKQAVAARNVARERYEKAVAAYNVLVNDLDKKLAARAGMQDIRKTLLLNATEGLKQLVAGGGAGQGAADRTLVAAYRQMGEVYQLIGETAKARDNFKKAVELAALVQMGATPADRRAADRDLGRSLDKLAGIHLQAGDTKAALGAADDAIKIFEKLAEDKNDAEAQKDLAAAKARRAQILMQRGDTGRALDDGRASLALRRALSEAAPGDAGRTRDLAAGLDALADLQLRTGKTKDAAASAEKALALRKGLAKALPDEPDARRELADAYSRLGEAEAERGQVTRAKGAYRSALEELKQLVAADEKSATAKADLAATYGRLSQAQLRTGDVEEAVASAKAGADLAAELQKDDPDSAKAKRDLALARARHGDALLAAGRTDAGVAEYAASEKLLRPLRDADRESERARLDLARALERLGDGRAAKGDAAGAAAAYRDSVSIREDVAKKDAGSASAKRDLATGLYKLATAYCGSGKPGEAEKFATRATNLFIELSRDDPDSAQAQRDVALGYAKWGQVLAAGGHGARALIVWQNALGRTEELAKIDAGDVRAKEDEAAAWERLAGFYAALGYADRALDAARTAVEQWSAIVGGVDARTKAGRYRLATAMLRCGDTSAEVRKLSQARDWYKKAAEEAKGDPDDPLLGPVAKRAAEQQVFADAVEAGLQNPAAVMDFPEWVRPAALRTVATLEVRADRPVTAHAVARQLVKVAATPADKFAAAKVFAACAASLRPTPGARDSYAADAVAQLKAAIAGDFRDLGALSAPEWQAVRKRAPEFAKVRAELEQKLKGEGK